MARYLRPALQYACQYWLLHAQHAGMELCDDGLIHHFLQKHYLHWLEVIGLMNKVREAVSIIIELENGITVSNIRTRVWGTNHRSSFRYQVPCIL